MSNRNFDGSMNFEIIQAISKDEISESRRLFEEYARSLDFSLCFQGFAEELASLPGSYAPPRGRLLLARETRNFAGCIALRPLSPEIGEVKRLYVRPDYRRLGIGRTLATRAIAVASEIGYSRLRLDTLASMTEAQALYGSLGFRETTPYYSNPIPGTVYMDLDLAKR